MSRRLPTGSSLPSALDNPNANRDLTDDEKRALQQRSAYDPATPPPPFGKAMLKYFAFDPEYINVNHGSYGSCPLPVLAECSRLALLSERNPDRFHRVTYIPLLKNARKNVAEVIGATEDEVVLVNNTTSGVNTVLRNIEWREGDVLFRASTTYGAVSQTTQYLADRSEAPRPTIEQATYVFPTNSAAIVEVFRTGIQEAKKKHSSKQFSILPTDSDEIVKQKAGANRFVAVIDSISSMPGIYFPWKKMVEICKEEGVWSVIDAAHSIGQETGINLSETQPDFWVSNCHKWLYAQRGCAVLYTPKRNQHIMKSSIPTSHDYRSPGEAIDGITDFVQQHEWTGTQNLVPFLSITPALAFRKWLGGEDKINAYTHKLAMEGGKRLAEILGTRTLDESGEFTLNMVNVATPLPEETPEKSIYTREIRAKISMLIQDRFFNVHNTFPGLAFHNGTLWCRISAQVWTEMSDFEYVGDALNKVCKEIRETILNEAA